MPLPPPMVELELLIVFSSTFYSAGLTSILVNLENKVLTQSLSSPPLPSPFLLIPPLPLSSLLSSSFLFLPFSSPPSSFLPSSLLPSSSSPLLVHHSAGLSVHGEVPLSEKRGQLLGHSQVCLVGQLLQARRESLCVCRRGDRGRGAYVGCDDVWVVGERYYEQQRCCEVRKQERLAS